MDQRQEGRTVSMETSLERLNRMQLLLFSVLLALPLIGLLVGLVFALKIVVSVMARSRALIRDMVVAVGIIAIGFIGMIAEVLWMCSGHVVLAIAFDAALNYCLLAIALNKTLGHVFTVP